MGKTYTGRDIEIGFEMSRCIHARNCFLKLPQVFDPAQRPWVQPDNASAEDIAAMVRTCPSGALTFKRLDGGVEESATPINRVTLYENGPMALQGDLQIEGEAMTRATLCRCGKSANKPHCDYAHVKESFAASGEPTLEPQKEDLSHEGGLTVTSVPNGPIKLDGPMEITTGTGRSLGTQSRAFLCRCGASKTKPFCDGSHKDIDFQA